MQKIREKVQKNLWHKDLIHNKLPNIEQWRKERKCITCFWASINYEDSGFFPLFLWTIDWIILRWLILHSEGGVVINRTVFHACKYRNTAEHFSVITWNICLNSLKPCIEFGLILTPVLMFMLNINVLKYKVDVKCQCMSFHKSCLKFMKMRSSYHDHFRSYQPFL